MKSSKKLMSVILSIMLVMVVSLSSVACNNKEDSKKTESPQASENQSSSKQVLGEGKIKFNFVVVDKSGNETHFEINTDKETVGDALLELDLIAGDEGQYGLYVKKVNGIRADYDKDGVYWAFYENGKYAQSGVDKTKIKEGTTYSFKVE